MKWYLWVLVVLVIGLISWANLAQGEFRGQNTEYAPQVAESLNLPPKQAKNQAILAQIEKLARCESGNRWNIKVLDTNGKYSYSGLQFQLDTFIRYNKIHKVLPDLEDGEALNAIYDEWTQRELAYRMLENGEWKNWYNCLAPLY